MENRPRRDPFKSTKDAVRSVLETYKELTISEKPAKFTVEGNGRKVVIKIHEHMTDDGAVVEVIIKSKNQQSNYLAKDILSNCKYNARLVLA